MTVLSVEDLRISYRSRGEWREVVHNISFSIQRGEMLAFVGESGSGKTTTAQAIIGLLADNARRDAGRIVLNGEVISDWSDKRLNRLRGVSISLVPQDPGNSLNPVKTIGQQVEEILRLHQSLSAAERRQQALNLLAKVGLSHPEQRFVAFTVRCLASSIDFYTRYTAMTVIHQREPDLPSARKVAWLSDRTRPFALVLVQSDDPADTPLGPFGHLGVACATQAEIDEKVALARREGVLRREPEQLGDPVGYFAFFADPDGNTLELSWGQRVGLEVILAGKPGE